MELSLLSKTPTAELSEFMSKAFIIFVILIYAAIKITEAIFGESDIYAIGAASFMALAVFLGVIVKKRASVGNAVLLVLPILIMVGLLSLRYFLQLGVADWMIWGAGLVAGVLCLGLFQQRAEPRY